MLIGDNRMETAKASTDSFSEKAGRVREGAQQFARDLDMGR